MADSQIELNVADALIERPIGFSIGHRHFTIPPLSLGKTLLVSRSLVSLGLKERIAKEGYARAAIQSVLSRRDDCLRIIAYMSLPGRDCLDEVKVLKRIKELRKIDVNDLASLLIVALESDKTEEITRHYGIDKETERYRRTQKAKTTKGTISFGGKSLWGTMIDFACERYGWSLEYVVWGISYCNLQLLVSDSIKTIYLTEDEKKKAHISSDNEVIRSDNKERLREFIKSQDWK